jgi:hypothetical protein
MWPAGRSWLIAERGIVITSAEVQRAPFELHAPLLRVSPHVDSATEDLDGFADALAEATELLSKLLRNPDGQPLRRDRLALPGRAELCCLTMGFGRVVFPTSHPHA